MLMFGVSLLLILGCLYMIYKLSAVTPLDSTQQHNKTSNMIYFIFLALMFGVIAYFTVPNLSKMEAEERYQKAYKQCHDKYSENDTMKNIALFVVQLQFKKMDNLSLAPKEPYRAIHILCDIEANNSKNLEFKHK